MTSVFGLGGYRNGTDQKKRINNFSAEAAETCRWWAWHTEICLCMPCRQTLACSTCRDIGLITALHRIQKPATAYIKYRLLQWSGTTLALTHLREWNLCSFSSARYSLHTCMSVGLCVNQGVRNHNCQDRDLRSCTPITNQKLSQGPLKSAEHHCPWVTCYEWMSEQRFNVPLDTL